MTWRRVGQIAAGIACETAFIGALVVWMCAVCLVIFVLTP